MKSILLISMIFVLFGFSGCDHTQWKMVISSPQNGATVATSAINMNGYLYLSDSFEQDNRYLKSLSAFQKEELAKKVPPLSGNIYCNSKKATIDRTNRTWTLNALQLTTQGPNTIFCYYQDSQGHTSQQTITVNYKPQTNISPVAKFDCQNNEPLKLSCDASASSDSDGTIVDYIYTVNGTENHSTNPIKNFTFSSPGSYSVSLVVKDNKGASSASVTKNFQVNGQPSVSQPIGASGGTITLPGYATVIIPANTFDSSSTVTISVENSPEILAEANSMGLLFGTVGSDNKFVKINSSLAPKDKIKVIISASKYLSNQQQVRAAQVGIFATDVSVNEEHDEVIERIRPIKSVNSNSSFEISLSPSNFDTFANSKAGSSSNIIQMTMGDDGGTGTPPTYGECSLVGFTAPFADLLATAPYNEWRSRPTPQDPNAGYNHRGMDFRAQSPTSIRAGFTGTVIGRGVECRGPRTQQVPNPPRVIHYYANSLDERNTVCGTRGNTTQIDYMGWGEFLAIKNKKGTASILYAHLSADSEFKAANSEVTNEEVIATSGNTGAVDNPYHLHLEFNGGPDALAANRTGANPVPCMLNANLKTFGTIETPTVPVGINPQRGDSCPNDTATCTYKSQAMGAWNVYKWKDSLNRTDTTCGGPPNFTYNAGNYTIELEVTDYWGNKDKVTKSFTVKKVGTGDTPAGSLATLVTRKVASPQINIFELFASPTAAFTATVQPGFPSNATLDASESKPGEEPDIVHTFKWFLDGNLSQVSCIPIVKTGVPAGCHDFKLTVEDSSGGIASVTKQVCGASGD